MRSIQLLGKKITGWQVLPSTAPDFEESALHACGLVLAHDPRIGKIPGSRRKPSTKIKVKRVQNRKPKSKPRKTN
jgi:hypothetical protein